MTNLIQVLIDALALGSIYALTALGIGLIFGVMRLINFAHGDLIMAGGYSLIVPTTAATSTLFIGAWPTPFLVAGVTLVVVLLALASERMAFRPVRRAAPSVLLITSFAVSYFMQNVVIMLYGGRPKAVNLWQGLMEPILIAGVRIPKLQMLTIAVTLGLLALLVLFLKRTPMGIAMRAASEDFRMARLLGVRANRVIAVAFAMSGVLAAAVSFLIVSQNGVLSYHMGVPLVLFAFVATVVGGMGSIVGAVLGGFTVGIASVIFQVYLPIEWRPNRDVWVYGMILLVLLVRPSGLVRVRSIEERA
ncbi:MAG: branched-chain amino acid ABC transporter permease [Alphaproteobacteria bacterium]|nr:branched-chain amino acid ABC transporter permease [Alphaproteobacteria bacterium]